MQPRAGNCHLEIARDLPPPGRHIDTVISRWGRTALHYLPTGETALSYTAMRYGDEAVEARLAHGADVDTGAETPLLQAIASCNCNLVPCLLAQGADPDAGTYNNKETALTRTINQSCDLAGHQLPEWCAGECCELRPVLLRRRLPQAMTLHDSITQSPLTVRLFRRRGHGPPAWRSRSGTTTVTLERATLNLRARAGVIRGVEAVLCLASRRHTLSSRSDHSILVAAMSIIQRPHWGHDLVLVFEDFPGASGVDLGQDFDRVLQASDEPPSIDRR
ncbi:hypothetical protein ASPACDRAFT_40824 [Aspergillus aculeatus ATCC 16872]|uniref:Uncharacterized protein n=1 Tax=Aspergillus aculeatus (strain ATCC 16872 / CBS 172.66 / WB 5094) TaxID=690307 RepID=A0A1L9X0F3_ASPA1|nr:uncharacterized protein ASPACDRAFT_40824 [Aspergillus aculeatus ATCC 16872]OJK02005.1 hypothetical protein ASPACDRAFT_40824 [Aspergillus aculeatus ATCC 16872]